MAPQATYSISSIEEIKSISASNRADGYCRISRDNDSWYIFKSSSKAFADNFNILMPLDEPEAGRWYRTNNNIDLPGVLICGYEDGACNVEGSGKVFNFFAPYHGQIFIQPSFDINIGDFWEQKVAGGTETRDKSIEVFLWEEKPYWDIGMDKRKFIANLPRAGGIVDIKADQTYRWLSVFACSENDSGRDATCFIVNNNVITLVDFSDDL